MSNDKTEQQQDTPQTPWWKRWWVWLAGIATLGVAIVLYALTRKQSPWAAQKILEIQGNAERQVQRITEKAAREQRAADQAYERKQTAIRDKERQAIQKVKQDARTMEATALKRKVLDDLDDPL